MTKMLMRCKRKEDKNWYFTEEVTLEEAQKHLTANLGNGWIHEFSTIEHKHDFKCECGETKE